MRDLGIIQKLPRLVCAQSASANPLYKSYLAGFKRYSQVTASPTVATAIQMGADLAWMGTRFINVEESLADDQYKKMIIESSAEDIVYTAAVSGVNGSFLRSSLEAMGITEEMWSKTKKIDFGSELDAAKAEAKAWKTIWSAGQGVTSIKENVFSMVTFSLIFNILGWNSYFFIIFSIVSCM